ncbi:hypothetical protein [Legionella cardiaca]|uniref:Coiled-coil protein n=1 Tax=Legionella cardiaca TaxID=1071983 RepID=A0ABY8ATQ0_9GAMM|nr:hypothetical protein [Legionella cardiaca]WED43858.1 hypothetical protein PXX05_03495 [Legionella cardiaca]
MAKVRLIGGRLQTVIPLQVKPHSHEAIPTLTGSAISHQAGTVLYGYYNMDFKLPNNDYLRIFANHNKKNVQLLWLTHDANKLKSLPGARPSSLVANAISQINRYCIRSDHYPQPRTQAQETKYKIATTCISRLTQLLPLERELSSDDWSTQEALRVKVIAILEECRSDNLLVATNPIVSEGMLDTIIYDAQQTAQHYQFNRLHPVCLYDQLDFSQEKGENFFVWDSELHIGQDEEALNDTIRVICQAYNLVPPSSLSNIAANRFKRLELFFRKLWLDGRDWINHLANPYVASQETQTEKRTDGLSITRIKPYYHLDGVSQIGYSSLAELIAEINKKPLQSYIEAKSMQEAADWLTCRPNGSWATLPDQRVLLRLNDEMVTINYFEEGELFYPLPSGEDIYTLSQLGKNHLYLPERAGLQLKAFFSRLPIFFKNLFHRVKQFIHDLYQEFANHIHASHKQLKLEEPTTKAKKPRRLSYLQEALYAHGLLEDGQTLEEFIKFQLKKNHYIIVREMHSPSPEPYENPMHRFLGVLRHIGGFFVDTSEKHPVIGTLAMAAYAYGAGAVIAPETLTSILTKLHLNGLIYGIKPTQTLAKWMSHGTTSEAISAATTYWQGIVVGGDLDQFFIKAISLFKEEPAQVAIIVALAISLGYGLCKSLPALEEEMGQFPYINYAALGAKGGAAIYDTVMHPGDDWLLGTIKWFLRGGLTLAKLIGGPFIEAYYYGYQNGFISGLKKSYKLFISSTKQLTAASVDFFLAVTTIPLLELSSLLIHVPFRGITKLLSKTLAILGNWQVVGGVLIEFAKRPNSWGYLPGFRLSPLYGFSSPFGHYTQNQWLNVVLNLGMLLLWPPLLLFKNFILLPAMDLSSFLIRFVLTLFDPVVRVLAFGLGHALTTGGFIWDNSLGRLFHFTAYAITFCSNKLDNFTGHLKQQLVAEIQIWRRNLYHWAFPKEEEYALHKTNTDVDYCVQNPMRIERLPHHSTECILKKLLSNASSNSSKSVLAEKTSHTSLFHPSLNSMDALSEEPLSVIEPTY